MESWRELALRHVNANRVAKAVVCLSVVGAVGCGEEGTESTSRPDASVGDCTPKTCAELSVDCGRVLDGCGGIAECGTCAAGETCGGAGPNLCGTGLCRPKTCLQLEASCGFASDRCSDVLDCGQCAAPFACGAGNKPNQCGCQPRSCTQIGANCGSAPDGCGGVLVCGECNDGQTCGGGGPNQCGSGSCASKTCAQVGASCGIASDTCSDVLECGSCASPDVCGGAGVTNQCGCSNMTCDQLGVACGSLAGGCGANVDCGACAPDDTCGGGGTPNQCGCDCQLPHAVTTCEGGPCHIRYCDDGWGECDGSEANGCETDLMGSATCPIPCTNDSQCPSLYSCIAERCAPWPVGLIVPWGGNALPKGWLKADGSEVNRTEWDELFASIGTTYGPGDGITTFQLPDLRGRFVLGQTESGTGATLAERFGSLDHNHEGLLSPHAHSVDAGAHDHDIAALPPHTHGWFFTLELNANPGPTPVFLKSQAGFTEPASSGPMTSSADGAGSVTTSSEASVVSLQTSNPPYLAMPSIILAAGDAEAPCGAIWHAAQDVPLGAVRADGAPASRSSEAWLFGCLKTAFGEGDGSSTFQLPDLRGRAVLGMTTAGTGAQLAQAGGSLDHTHTGTVNAVAHSVTMLGHTHTTVAPAHSHEVVSPAPEHSVTTGFQFGCVNGFEPNTGPSVPIPATSGAASSVSASVQAAPSVNLETAAGNAPFLVLQSVLYQNASHRLSTGTVIAFAGTKVPFGWLVADGSEVSRATYAPLFAVIGTTFGSGDGSSTFSLPDLRGRTAFGEADGGPAAQLAAAGGSLDHVHDFSIPEHVHAAVFPSHTHPFHFDQHVHTLNHTQLLANDDFASVESARGVTVQVTSDGSADVVSQPAAAPATNTSAGGGGAFTSQGANAPYLVLRYIIQT